MMTKLYKITAGIDEVRKGQEKDSDADSWTTVFMRRHSQWRMD